FRPEFDVCFSRFGMMFFSNPVAAMRNIRSALKPGGQLMFVTWRALADNPFMAIPKQIVLQYLPPPGENAQTCGPGPFSMANPEVVTAQLKAAGFEKAQFTRTDGTVMVGSSVEQAMDFQLALGPAGEIFREAGAQAERGRPQNGREFARRTGLFLAMFLRIALLFLLSLIVGLVAPLFTILGQEISGRDLILIAGGVFIIWKSTKEIHQLLIGGEDEASRSRG